MLVQENPENIENTKNAQDQSIIENLFENGLSGITSGWMRHEIDCKVRAITSFFMFDLSVKANENLKKKVADKMAEEQSACSTVLTNVQTTQKQIDSTNENIQRFVDLRQVLMQRMAVMSVYIGKQIDPKIDNSLKLNNALMRKIGELKNVMEKIEAIHQEEMAEKACELDLCERQDANISKRSTDIHPKFDEIAAETEQENSKIEALKTGLKEAQQIINNVESTAASTAQLTSEIEVQNDAWKKLQNTAEMAQIEMQTSLTRIEQLKMDRKVAETQNTILNQRLDEIFYLMDFVKQKTGAREMEDDPVFKREVMERPYFFEHKENLDREIRDNKILNEDLSSFIDQIQEQMQQIDEAKHENDEAEAVLAQNRAELDEIDRDIKAQQLQEYLDEVRKAEELLKKEISDLTNEADREKAEHLKLQILHSENLARYNLKLKQEQAKTRKAREQHNETLASKTLILSSAKDSGNVYSFHSQLLQQTVSNATPSQQIFKAFSSQQIPPASKTVSEHYSTTSNASSSHQDLPVSKAKPVKMPLKRPFEETTSNAQELGDKASKRFIRSSVTYSLNNTLQSAESIASPDGKVPIEIPEKRRATLPLPKENQMPVYLPTAEELKAKSTKEAEEEKAFDSDETSFNVTFNTDIDDLLD